MISSISAQAKPLTRVATVGAPHDASLVEHRQVQVLENFEIRFGPAPAWVQDRVAAIADADRLRGIARLVLTCDSLDELFAAL